MEDIPTISYIGEDGEGEILNLSGGAQDGLQTDNIPTTTATSTTTTTVEDMEVGLMGGTKRVASSPPLQQLEEENTTDGGNYGDEDEDMESGGGQRSLAQNSLLKRPPLGSKKQRMRTPTAPVEMAVQQMERRLIQQEQAITSIREAVTIFTSFMAVSENLIKDSEVKVTSSLNNIITEINNLSMMSTVTEQRMTAAETQLKDHTSFIAGMNNNINSMSRAVGRLEQQQGEVAKRFEEMDQRLLKVGTGGEQPPQRFKAGAADPEMEAALFIGGVLQMKEMFNMMDADPLGVVSHLLNLVSCSCAVDGMFPADGKAATRKLANGVVVFMRTPYHKKEALIRVKRFIMHNKLDRAAVRDCFPGAALEEARRQTQKGAQMKRRGEISRYRVINIRGQPVLQVGSGDRPFHTVEERHQEDNRMDQGEQQSHSGADGATWAGARSKLTAPNTTAVGQKQQQQHQPPPPPPATLQQRPTPTLVGLQPIRTLTQTKQLQNTQQLGNMPQQQSRQPHVAQPQHQRAPLEQRPQPQRRSLHQQGQQSFQQHLQEQPDLDYTSYNNQQQQRQQQALKGVPQRSLAESDSDNNSRQQHGRNNRAGTPTTDGAWAYCGTSNNSRRSPTFKPGHGPYTQSNDYRNDDDL
jgi:hypothetical protein